MNQNQLRDNPDKYRLLYENNEFFGPWVTKIKLFSYCNLQCSKCNVWKDPQEKNKNNISLKRVYELLDELSGISGQCVKFSGGEVTLLTELPDLIAYASQKKLKPSITTNGTLIDKDLAKRLVDAGLERVRVSIDTDDAELHDRMVNMNGAWKKSIEAVQNLSDYSENSRKKIIIKIAVVVSKANYRNLVSMANLAADHGAHYLSLLPLDQKPLQDRDLIMDEQHLLRLNAEIVPDLISRCSGLGIGLDNPYPYGRSETRRVGYLGTQQIALAYRRIPCFTPWYYIFVRRNGDVHSCCFYKGTALGNVKQQSLVEIIAGEAYRSLRARCKPPIQIERCQTCLTEIEQNDEIWRILQLDHLSPVAIV